VPRRAHSFKEHKNHEKKDQGRGNNDNTQMISLNPYSYRRGEETSDSSGGKRVDGDVRGEGVGGNVSYATAKSQDSPA